MDLRTLFITNILLYYLSMATLISVWFHNRMRYKGILSWAAYAGLSATGDLLIYSKSVIPENGSIGLANLFLIASIYLLLRGFESFFGQPRYSNYTLVSLIIVLLLTLLFTFERPALHVRQILISGATFLVLGQILGILAVQRTVRPRRNMIAIGGTLFLMAALHLARVFVNAFCVVKPVYCFDNGPAEALFMVLNVALLVALTFNELSIISQRLVVEVEADRTKFDQIFKYAPYSIILTKLADHKIMAVNDCFVKLCGYSREQLIGRRSIDLGLWSDSEYRGKIFDALSEDHPAENVEMMLRRSSGEIFPCLLSAVIVTINGEKNILSSLKDVSDIVELRVKLEALATHDPLTQLPNRNLFEDRFAIARSQAIRTDSKFAIAIFDLDDFKLVNDQFGHHVGDKILIAVAERAGRYLRLSDTVARFGGDEFVILLNNVQNKAAARETLLRLVEQYQFPFAINDQSIFARISIGAALFPDDANTLYELIHNADHALYQVKREGKNNIKFYTGENTPAV